MCLNDVISKLQARQRAFTLIELLVVIAIIAILAAVLLPVLHQAQLRGETAACVDHQKQLATAWLMYASDNNDGCAGNEWSGNPGGEQGWMSYRGKFSPAGSLRFPTNWISGWMDPSGQSPNGDLSDGEADNTNDDLLIDPSYASLGDYVKNRQIFICPASLVKVAGTPGGSKIYNEIRSVSMNCWVGYISAPPEPPTSYKEFWKTTSITAGIGPADLFVFIEERGESIDDGSFETEMGQSSTIANFPTDYHNNAATIGFADGHVEVHRWTGEPTTQGWSCTSPQDPEVNQKWNFGTITGGAKALTDLDWMQNHATIPIQ